MPVWLSPRGRLGMMAAVIVVIACTVLLTRDGDDRHFEHFEPHPVPVDAAIEQVAATPSAAPASRSIRPSISLDAITPGISDLWAVGMLDGITDVSSSVGALDLPSGSVSTASREWPSELFAKNIVTPPPGCGDCGSWHSSVGGSRSGGFVGGGSGTGAAGGAAGGSGSAGPGGFHESLAAHAVQALLAPQSLIGPSGNEGSSDSRDSSLPPEASGLRQSPNLVTPGPGVQQAVSVPEPSTMILLGTGVAAVMMRRGSARKRRG